MVSDVVHSEWVKFDDAKAVHDLLSSCGIRSMVRFSKPYAVIVSDRDFQDSVRLVPRKEEKVPPEAIKGRNCRHCKVPLVKKKPKRNTPRHGQQFRYEWYFYCEKCKRMYMVEEAKVPIT